MTNPTHTRTPGLWRTPWRTLPALLLLLAFTAPTTAQAQCLLYPVSLEDRATDASLIVEGRVTQKVSFWNTEHSMIYTANMVEVYKVLKGSLNTGQIVVLTDGGTVWPDMIVATPALSLTEGEMGVLFLGPNTVNGASFGSPVFQPVADEQGFVKYSEDTPNRAEDAFNIYHNIQTDLFAVIEQYVGQQLRVIQPAPVIGLLGNGGKGGNPTPMAQPVISSLSPTTITAGTRSVLTINGSNFGTNTSSARVQFRNADDGGASFVSALASDIVSWSNTQIQVRVPSGAGTGVVRVTNNTNETGTSTSSLTILYNYTNVENNGVDYAPRLVSDNGQGGYTLTYNTSFNSNANAKAAFGRALETWRCNTFVNFGVASTTSSISTAASDNTNIVTFGTLPSGVLGRTTSYYSGCFVSGGANFYVTEIDQVYAPTGTINWNFTTANATASQMDFQSVVVHELGHGHQLGHIIFTGRIMHYAIGNGQTQRVLNQASDIDGGNAVMAASTSTNVCGTTRMTALTAGTCSLTPTSAPVADFSATPTSTTVGQTVAFTDLTTNNPTSWNWSITPATFSFTGGTSATSQNPTVTFSAAGQYTVTLTATNSAGNDAETKTNYITVSPYCIPAYSTTTGQGTADGDFIDDVQLGSINNQNTGSQGGPTYTSYTNLSTSIARNSSQTLNVTIGTYGDANSWVAAWIDWNQDGDFADAGEKIGERKSLTASQTVPFAFTVPGSATLGNTRMRIRSVWSNTATAIDPCTSYDYGEAEDYTVNIISGTAAAPVANFQASATTTTVGQTVTLTDLSTNSPTSWAWSITPGTHSYVGGTSATSQNPQVTFSATGQYTVTLTATNATGSDGETKTNYITVTSSAPCDTLNLDGFDDPALYNVTGGYWPGHHNFSGTRVAEFAQQFTAAGQSHLNGVFLQFARAKTLNPATSSITVRLYNNNAGLPGTVIASENVLIQTIINAVNNPQAQGLIFVDFGGSTALPGNNFFIGFTINYTAGDTVALVANDITANTVNTGFAFLPAPTSAWQPMSAIFQGNPNWRLAIFAQVGPKPTASYTASATSVCTNQTVQFTSTAANAAQHLWQFPGGTPATSTAANPTVTYSAAGTYTVRYYVGGNCGGIDSVISTNQITVSTPTPLNPTANPTSVCAGGSSTLSITGAGTFEWLQGANVIGTGNSISVTPGATTTYTVRQAGATCTSQGNVTVTVNAPPVVNAGQDVSICGSGTTVLTGSATGTGTLQYAWTPTTGLANPNQASTAASPTTTTTYTLTVTNTTTGCVATDKVIVTVAQPTLAIITSNGLTNICPGGSVALAGNSGTGFQYQWLRNNSTIGGANSVNYTATQGGTYSLILTDANGCRDTSNNIVVTVLTPPSASVSVNGATTICQGDSTVLEAAPTAPNYLYTWLRDGNPIAGATDSSYSVKQTGGYQLVLREFGNNCSDTSATITITVNPASATPNISVVSGSLNFCQGDSVVLDAGQGFINYRWSNGATGRFVTIKNTVNSLTVTADNGCGDQTSSAVNPQALPAPSKPTITQTGGSLSTTATEPTYEWRLNGTSVVGTTSSISPTQSGTYTVTVRNAAGCSATSDPFVFNVTAIDPAQVAAGTLSVYPNPTVSTLNLRISMTTAQPVALRILDINGKVVLTQDLANQGASFEHQLDISTLASGTYFLEVQMGAQTEVRKVVKQ